MGNLLVGNVVAKAKQKQGRASRSHRSRKDLHVAEARVEVNGHERSDEHTHDGVESRIR